MSINNNPIQIRQDSGILIPATNDSGLIKSSFRLVVDIDQRDPAYASGKFKIKLPSVLKGVKLIELQNATFRVPSTASASIYTNFFIFMGSSFDNLFKKITCAISTNSTSPNNFSFGTGAFCSLPYINNSNPAVDIDYEYRKTDHRIVKRFEDPLSQINQLAFQFLFKDGTQFDPEKMTLEFEIVSIIN